MAAIIHALDKHTMQQVGEKGNVEHTWSFDVDEKIPQFFFQLVRSDDHTNLKRQLRQILLHFRGREAERIVQMCSMYKLIGQTRDIVAGKGEQQLSFMLLWGWYEFYPSLVEKAFEHFVLLRCHYSLHPYGSWKDIKYWCQYVYEHSKDKNHPLIHHALDFAIRQLLFDEARYELWYEKKKGKPILSLCGKWLPREKSKYGWVFRLIAEKMYGHFQNTASTVTSKKKAILKGRIMLKKLLVKLNRYLDTAQIKMCGERWSQLKFNNITSQTLRRNKLAIMNTTKKGEQRSEKTDRLLCSQKYTNHLALAKADPAHHKIHGKRCGVYELVKDEIKPRIFRIMTIDPIGRAEFDSEHLLEPEQVRQVIDFLKMEYQQNCSGYADQKTTMVELGCGGWLGKELEGTIRPFIFHCIAGINNLGILYDGKLASCSNISREFIEGDLRKDSIKDVWENRYQRYRNLNWKKVGPCVSCDEWDYCHGGPMHRSHVNTDECRCLYMNLGAY